MKCPEQADLETKDEWLRGGGGWEGHWEMMAESGSSFSVMKTLQNWLLMDAQLWMYETPLNCIFIFWPHHAECVILVP